MAARRLLPGPRSVEGRFSASRRFDGLVPSSRAVPGARGVATSPCPSVSLSLSLSHLPFSLLSPDPALRSQRLLVRLAALETDLSCRRGQLTPSGRECALGSASVGPRRVPFSAGSESFLRWLLIHRPQLERDDPLNLSILLRGGKENNDDSLSKGD